MDVVVMYILQLMLENVARRNKMAKRKNDAKWSPGVIKAKEEAIKAAVAAVKAAKKAAKKSKDKKVTESNKPSHRPHIKDDSFRPPIKDDSFRPPIKKEKKKPQEPKKSKNPENLSRPDLPLEHWSETMKRELKESKELMDKYKKDKEPSRLKSRKPYEKGGIVENNYGWPTVNARSGLAETKEGDE